MPMAKKRKSKTSAKTPRRRVNEWEEIYFLKNQGFSWHLSVLALDMSLEIILTPRRVRELG